MKRTFVIGDIHGAYEALVQVMDRSGFNFETDKLIFLGDVADRRTDVLPCVDLLLKVKNLVMILGNHDRWALEWMSRVGAMGVTGQGDLNDGGGFDVNDLYEKASEVWLTQGGSDTIVSYQNGVPERHYQLIKSAKFYHIEDDCLFVHGGIDHRRPLESQDPEDFLWDRSLVEAAIRNDNRGIKLGDFREIYVGHTPTITLGKFLSADSASETGEVSGKEILESKGKTDQPMNFCNVWLMDTGAGWTGGRLSMMNLSTREVWQSDTLE